MSTGSVPPLPPSPNQHPLRQNRPLLPCSPRRHPTNTGSELHAVRLTPPAARSRNGTARQATRHVSPRVVYHKSNDRRQRAPTNRCPPPSVTAPVTPHSRSLRRMI